MISSIGALLFLFPYSLNPTSASASMLSRHVQSLTEEMTEAQFPVSAEFNADYVPLITEAWKTHLRTIHKGQSVKLSQYRIALGEGSTFLRVHLYPRLPTEGEGVTLGSQNKNGKEVIYIFDKKTLKLLHRIIPQ